jgi:hypothetical protein
VKNSPRVKDAVWLEQLRASGVVLVEDDGAPDG